MHDGSGTASGPGFTEKDLPHHLWTQGDAASKYGRYIVLTPGTKVQLNQHLYQQQSGGQVWAGWDDYYDVGAQLRLENPHLPKNVRDKCDEPNNGNRKCDEAGNESGYVTQYELLLPAFTVPGCGHKWSGFWWTLISGDKACEIICPTGKGFIQTVRPMRDTKWNYLYRKGDEYLCQN